jgi:hypothetical protein
MFITNLLLGFIALLLLIATMFLFEIMRSSITIKQRTVDVLTNIFDILRHVENTADATSDIETHTKETASATKDLLEFELPPPSQKP